MTPDEYQQAARELARTATMPEEVAARMERDLERAFDGASTGSLAGSKDAALPGWVGLAAAAALILVIGAGFWSARQRSVAPSNVAVAVAPPVPAATVAGLNPRHSEDGVTPNVRRRATKPRPPLPPVVQPAGFVPVPAVAELPQFESGVIVRLSLPVAALPSYGVDISPASSGDAVEADVLVAQDGVARAIRLVSPTRSQQ